ncbi:MAG: peroxiredoxin family protein [Jatrophihabitantaceae bacterium]
MPLLHPGDAFPKLTVTPAGAEPLVLPDTFAGRFGVVLFYRGSWCPYCNAQLRGFERSLPDLDELGVGVVAMSVDDEMTTRATVDRHRLSFPVGYGADARMVSEVTGAFVNDDPLHLQSTGFVLDPSGRVLVSVYSSAAIGRLVPDDVIGLVRYVRDHAAA